MKKNGKEKREREKFSILNSQFSVKMTVRDYELDRFGMVNNAVYQNYLEHTRHLFLESRGVNMDDLYRQGYSPVITRAEIEYRGSLQSGNDFVVRLQLEKLTRVKFVFLQEIWRQPSEVSPEHPARVPEETLVTAARITGTILNAIGRPRFPESFQSLRELLS